MPSQVLATGVGGTRFGTVLHHGFSRAKPEVLGVAVAYVSVTGLQYLQKLVEKYGVEGRRLVTDTKDGITHPMALRTALDCGWDVRVVDELAGTFHPKLYLGGAAFHAEDGMTGISMILSGSANLSAAALYRNGECSYLSVAPKLGASAGKAWKEFWEIGTHLTVAKLVAYERYFSLRNRNRPAADMVALGVAEEDISTQSGELAKRVRPPPNDQKALSNTAATTVWAGLQSFTGDYNLQVEFPRDTGAVLLRLLGGAGSKDFLCDDSVTRPFIFRYYPDNGMFRLNVHNGTPDTAWAREHKDGIAVVENNDDVFTFRILKPGRAMVEVVNRSFALGTWGRTPTRQYGWY